MPLRVPEEEKYDEKPYMSGGKRISITLESRPISKKYFYEKSWSLPLAVKVLINRFISDILYLFRPKGNGILKYITALTLKQLLWVQKQSVN